MSKMYLNDVPEGATFTMPHCPCIGRRLPAPYSDDTIRVIVHHVCSGNSNRPIVQHVHQYVRVECDPLVAAMEVFA